MNANAQKWVEALRSGDYTQGTGYLTTNGSDCCLGVACKLAIADGVEVSVKQFLYGHTEYSGETASLPEPVRRWLGLRTIEGSYFGDREPHDGEPDDLTVDNDEGKTFAEIAAIIESEPAGLFE